MELVSGLGLGTVSINDVQIVFYLLQTIARTMTADACTIIRATSMCILLNVH
jgi:hypothetical protein